MATFTLTAGQLGGSIGYWSGVVGSISGQPISGQTLARVLSSGSYNYYQVRFSGNQASAPELTSLVSLIINGTPYAKAAGPTYIGGDNQTEIQFGAAVPAFVSATAYTVELSAGSSEDALTASSLTAAAPTIGTAALGQVHALDGADIAASAPTLGTPVVSDDEAIIVRPVSTDSAGGWETNSGGSDLHTAIDETAANDSDFARSPASPSGQVARIKLGTFSSTAFTQDLVLRYRIGKAGPQAVDMTVRLVEGANTIDEWVHSGVDALATITQTVDPELIGDFSDLYLEVEAA